VPGGYNPQATECFQEGVLIPPVKLFRKGVLQQDVVDILQANTRLPRSNWGDLNGQLNALDLGERRFHALIDEYGDDVVAATLQAASARAEALMRQEIRALPDGIYSFEDYLDNDGIVDERLTIALELTIAGRAPRRPAADLLTSRGPRRLPAAMSRSSTCSPMSRPMLAC
jgi:N-methylhydantoinase B